MRYNKIYFFVIALLLSSISFVSFAQTARIVRGVVTDKLDGLPLPGASVIIKNENGRMIKGVITDVDGRYAIDFNISNAILQVSFVGFTAFEVRITDQSVIDVALDEAPSSLGEVLITGQARPTVDMGYMKVAARDNAAAVSSINIGRITHSSATSALEMMQGRAAGVQITAESGDPGAGYTIKIRGSTSINSSSNPLFVIDGIQYSGNVGEFSDLMELTTSRSPLQDVHPDDIESIEVLKDAGATAIYGSRGANGVVLITTKRGRANFTQIQLSSNASISFLPKDIPLLSGDDLKVFILEGMQNREGYSTGSLVYPELRDDPSRADYWEYNNNTDWVKEVQRVAWTVKNNISLSGGGSSTVYRFSLGTVNQQGTIIGKSYNMFTARFNLDYVISKHLSLQSSIGYTRADNKDGGDGIADGMGMLSFARRFPSFYPVYWPDGEGGYTNQYYVPFNDNIEIYNRNMYNPVAWGNLVNHDRANNKFASNISVSLKIIEGLSLLSRVNFDFSNNSFKIFVPHAATNRNWHDDSWVNLTRRGRASEQYIGQENLLAFKREFAEIHELSFTGVARFDWWYDDSFSQGATNTGSNLTTGMNAATRWNRLNSSRGHDVYNTNVFVLHYKLLDRYIIYPSINYEGSSRFGEANRYGVFPQLALRWRLSGEPFMQSLTFVDDFSFRYSWGLTGESPRDKYLYFSVYESGGSRYIDKVGTTAGGLQLNTLKWEVTTKNNLGMDASFFDGRLRVISDLYDDLVDDLLMKRSLPSSSGYGDYWTNYGVIRKRGFEFEARGAIVRTGDILWELNGNISFIRSKIVNLPDDEGLETDWHHGYPFMVKEGDVVGSFYGLRYKGVYATTEDAVALDREGNPMYEMDGRLKPVRWENQQGYVFRAGDAIYEDLNHDGLINDADRTIIGNANPSFYGGMGTTFRYKNLTFDIFFQYQYGNDVINLVRKEMETMNGGSRANINQSQSVMRRWRKEGDITEMPRVTFDPHRNAEGSDRFIEDASYCRLKNVSISYELPHNFISKLGISKASVFLNGYNLYTWTNYLGVDPEIRAVGPRDRPFRVGLDESRTPVPRSVTFGFNVTF